MSDPRGRCWAPSSDDWLEGELPVGAGLDDPRHALDFTHTWVEHPAEPLLTALHKLKLIDEDGEGPDEDQWDGYPAERRTVLELPRGPPTTSWS